MDSKTLKLLREIYFNRNGILLLVVSGIGTWTAYEGYGSTGFRKELLVAISTGLYASALFAFLQSLLTGLKYEALVAQSIEERIESATRRVLEQAMSLQREFLPAAEYPAAMSPDRRFNRDLTADLRSTQRYFFRGVTGLYTMSRVLATKATLDEVHILVANPQYPRSMEARVTHIVSYIEPGSKYEEVFAKLSDEIVQTVVAARLAASRCRSLTLYLQNEPQVDRVELFDKSLFLTLYSDSADRDAKFPRSLRFDNTSSLYRIYMAQLSRSRDWATSSISIRPTTTDNELINFIGNFGVTVDSSGLRDHEAKFAEFSKKFEADVTQSN